MLDGRKRYVLIKKKGVVSLLVASREPEARPNFQVGSHWHWESVRTKLMRITALCGLSDHIFRGLRCQAADEYFLEHEKETFL